MSRFRKPEKQLSEWDEWSLPEPSASGSRHVNGWSELEGPLNTDYGLASDGQEMAPPMRGLFAVPREYPPKSSSVQSQWDADSAAAFWAFPEAQVQSPTAAEQFESPHRALEQRPSDQSQSRASYYGGWGEDDDDRRSVASYRTARVTAQVIPTFQGPSFRPLTPPHFLVWCGRPFWSIDRASVRRCITNSIIRCWSNDVCGTPVGFNKKASSDFKKENFPRKMRSGTSSVQNQQERHWIKKKFSANP